MDFFAEPPVPQMSALPCRKYFIRRVNALHSFFATWELILCGEGHTKGDQEGGRKSQLNGIAFINQCHIMHSAHR